MTPGAWIFIGIVVAVAALIGALFLLEHRVKLSREALKAWETLEHNRIIETGRRSTEELFQRLLPVALQGVRDEVKEIAIVQTRHGERLDALEKVLITRPRSIEDQIGIPRLVAMKPGQEPTPLQPSTASTEPEGTDPSQLRTEGSGG